VRNLNYQTRSQYTKTQSFRLSHGPMLSNLDSLG
jgi:hypothetical protein